MCMSKVKAVRILGRGVWVLDNSHDIVVARMVEEAERLDVVDAETLQNWRVWASIPDLAFHHEAPTPSAVDEILSGARARIERHGDVRADDLTDWRLLDDIAVSGGFLRDDPLPVESLLDVLDGFADLFAATLEPDPRGAWWFLGAPGGRRTIAMRERSPEG